MDCQRCCFALKYKRCPPRFLLSVGFSVADQLGSDEMINLSDSLRLNDLEQGSMTFELPTLTAMSEEIARSVNVVYCMQPLKGQIVWKRTHGGRCYSAACQESTHQFFK